MSTPLRACHCGTRGLFDADSPARCRRCGGAPLVVSLDTSGGGLRIRVEDGGDGAARTGKARDVTKPRKPVRRR